MKIINIYECGYKFTSMGWLGTCTHRTKIMAILHRIWLKLTKKYDIQKI